MDHWLKDFHLQVNYREDFGVTTEIASKLVKKGFGLGGEFERKVNTTWSVSGSFSVPAGS